MHVIYGLTINQLFNFEYVIYKPQYMKTRIKNRICALIEAWAISWHVCGKLFIQF